MKKALLIILTMLLIFSFTGCLKDDYEALEKEIVDVEEETDELKDELDLIEIDIQSIKQQIETAKDESESLSDESDSLYLSKEHIEEQVDIVKDNGLGITKFEFERAFYGLYDLDEYFEDLTISFLPYQYMSDSERILKYYMKFDGQYSADFYFLIIMCEDNIHIKEIFKVVSEEIVDEYKDIANKYLYAMCISYIMAKEKNYDDLNAADETCDLLMKEEPMFNNTAQYDLYYDDGYYCIAIFDISK